MLQFLSNLLSQGRPSSLQTTLASGLFQLENVILPHTPSRQISTILLFEGLPRRRRTVPFTQPDTVQKMVNLQYIIYKKLYLYFTITSNYNWRTGSIAGCVGTIPNEGWTAGGCSTIYIVYSYSSSRVSLKPSRVGLYCT